MRTLFFWVCIVVSANLKAQNGKIYFTSGVTNNRRQKNIGVIDPDGNNYKDAVKTISPRSEYQAHVSPDGKQVTFNTYRYGGWKIGIANIDGSNARKLTKSNNYEYDASWSPDGSKIVLIGFERGNSGKRQLFLVDVATQEKTLLTDGKYAHYSPSFISDNEIIFSVNNNGFYGIYKMNLNDKKQTKVVDHEDFHEIAPRISPNKEWLAYHRINDDRLVELVILKMSSKEEKVIYQGWNGREGLSNWESPLFPFSIGWSPDSNQLVFTSMVEKDNYELVRIDRDGQNRKRLTFNEFSDTQPHWSEK